MHRPPRATSQPSYLIEGLPWQLTDCFAVGGPRARLRVESAQEVVADPEWLRSLFIPTNRNLLTWALLPVRASIAGTALSLLQAYHTTANSVILTVLAHGLFQAPFALSTPPQSPSLSSRRPFPGLSDIQTLFFYTAQLPQTSICASTKRAGLVSIIRSQRHDCLAKSLVRVVRRSSHVVASTKPPPFIFENKLLLSS